MVNNLTLALTLIHKPTPDLGMSMLTRGQAPPQLLDSGISLFNDSALLFDLAIEILNQGSF